MIPILVLLSLTVPLLFTVEKNEVTFTFEVNYSNHTEIFNYLSKVENFPVLNPTIYRIDVVRGNEDEFTIRYDEYLSHFPAITNSGTAHYKLVRGDTQEMQSNHSTCFFREYICLPTTAVLRINAVEGSRTGYEEVIRYNCPWIMTAFCLGEIFYQRMAIMDGIEHIFALNETS